MSAGVRRATPRPRPAISARAADAGFTLIEILVSIMVMTLVMTALSTFFVKTMTFMSKERDRQAAVQLATHATEQVRALRGSAIDDGRVKGKTTSTVYGVAANLADADIEQWNVAASGVTPSLATTPVAGPTINKITYYQHWFVGKCWQQAAGGDCTSTRTTNDVEYVRVVVAVTWPAATCASAGCSYVTSTLVSNAASEPTFNANEQAQPAKPDNPGNLTGEVDVPVNLTMTVTGGEAPLTWSATGLPTNVIISSDGIISGTPTAAGTFSVTARVTDAFGLIGSAAFTWTIVALPSLTKPANQTHSTSSTVNLAITRTGGTAPFTWSMTAPGPWGATGLPPGLTLNTSTGVITGRPTTTGAAKAVTVNVTDKYGKTASTTFSWTVT